MADDVGPLRTDAKLDARARDDRRADAGARRAAGRRRRAFDLRARSIGSTCATCCSSRSVRRTARRCGAPRAAARTSARIFPRCCPSGASTRWCGCATERIALRLTPSHPRWRRNERAPRQLKVWRGARPGGRPMGDATRCRSSRGSRCSTACAGSGSTATRASPSAISCINANACKECMIELDGKTVYACTARLEPREMTLAPLSNKTLVRDLVTEIAPPAERFAGEIEIATPDAGSPICSRPEKKISPSNASRSRSAICAAGSTRCSAQGELHEVDAEVDWNIELGTIMRLAQGPGTGQALMFNNIKDYNKPDTRCRRVFGCWLNSYRRIAMMIGLPPDTHPRELVKIGRTHPDRQHSAEDRQATGPVKENIVTGNDIDLFELADAVLEPARRRALSPHLRRRRHPGSGDRRDERRRLSRHGGGPQPHPDPDVARPAYRPSLHRLAATAARPRCRSRSRSAGSRRSASRGGTPVPKGVCEYDVMGAIRGAPVELVKCETDDLYVPASAEIVIEGFLGLDPATYLMEGPVRRVHRLRRRRPLAEADHPGHRHHPPQRSDPARHDRRLDAGQLFGERRGLLDHARRHGLERARPRRRAWHHRRVVPAGAGRHQRADPA